eukprot:CAMPEP_0197648518 /NCGR_PEP_ID=MMETSP1338-20131121/27809_1 /TAXON_ID=43686 ORGANISM="Pelagodinium beii, Strain RCC1491" /NCGR_SAMPLE_ID=MMETSP1338 /ASSEMBLY_ACC=CAM_ASM_000754 /LENGTH=461 /DNA_ID=CAMNT_0043222543 /DNA_START=71 /DNA_END=1456 /DNA_ORIENTATION=+
MPGREDVHSASLSGSYAGYASSLPSEGSRALSANSSVYWNPSHQHRVRQRVTSVVGLSLGQLSGGMSTSESAVPLTPSKLRRTGSEIISPTGAPQRLLATAFDSDWQVKPNLPRSSYPGQKELEEECKLWLASVVRKKKKQYPLAGLASPRSSPRKADQTLPRASENSWNPLQSLKELGPPLEEENDGESDFGEEAPMDDLGREMSVENEEQKPKRRRSILMKAGALVIPGFEDQIGPELVNLKDITQSEGIPYEITKNALDCFFQFADPKSDRTQELTIPAILAGKRFEVEDLGSMDEEKFENACCFLAKVPDVSEFDDGFMERAMESADRDNSNDIDFVEFLAFYNQFCFSEEVLLSTEERKLRKIARKYNLDLLVMDKFRIAFQAADEDKSGSIEYEEFSMIVQKLLKIPKDIGLPERRLKDMWRDAKGPRNKTDSLDLDGFVGFYMKNFGDDAMVML